MDRDKPLRGELSHKPILAVDYEKIDIYDGGGTSTDAIWLTLGRAQWDNTDISAKVFRNVEGAWTRQSEELPLNRVVDLTTLLVAALKKNDADNPRPISNLNEFVNSDKAEYNWLKQRLKDKNEGLSRALKELKRLLDDTNIDDLFSGISEDLN